MIDVRTGERFYDGRIIATCEVVIGGIIFRTDCASRAHAIELACRAARALGLDCEELSVEVGDAPSCAEVKPSAP